MINELKRRKVRVFFENFHDSITSIDAICLGTNDGCILLKEETSCRLHVFPLFRIFRIVEIESK